MDAVTSAVWKQTWMFPQHAQFQNNTGYSWTIQTDGNNNMLELVPVHQLENIFVLSMEV